MIAYQRNSTGIVCLLPDGRVEWLHPAAEPLLEAMRTGEMAEDDADLDSFILADILVDLDEFRLAAPVIAFIETTNLCNLRCTHCYADSGLRRENELSTERLLGLIDECADMGVLQLFLTGGELFAHRDAVRLISHARSKPFSTQIFTNGLLITDEKLRALPAGTSFFVSFDTASPTRTARGRMDFPTLARCFDMMARHGHIVRTAVSVHSQNIQDVEEIFDWCAREGYPRPQWLETHPVGRALLHPHLFLTAAQVDEVFGVYVRCMDRFAASPSAESEDDTTRLTIAGRANARTVRAIDTIKFCQRLEQATGMEKCGRTVAYIASNGDVYPCSNCMSGRLHVGGNVTSRALADVWDGDGFGQFRRQTFADHSACATCPVHHAGIWCQFRCAPLARNLTGSETGCGATEYLREFMLRSSAYWAERARNGTALTMYAPTT